MNNIEYFNYLNMIEEAKKDLPIIDKLLNQLKEIEDKLTEELKLEKE